VLQSCYQAAQELYAEIAAKHPSFKKALDSVNAVRNEQLPWWQVADYAFDTLMLTLRNRG
jgi:TRAP-type mannitol/chloroaromatic compound transport system substrate-binding protein